MDRTQPPSSTGQEPERKPYSAPRLSILGSVAELQASRGPAAGPATVLLSPAAASFDMFVDYAARGRAFKTAVAALAARRKGRDR